jgi:death-on-curing protein
VKLQFVRGDVLRNVHGRLIEKYGGISGVRDENALESAIGRPRNLEAYGEVTSVARLGAALAWSLLRNHPFADGNKRSAFAAMDMFFELNGYRLMCSEVEETAMVIRAAGSEIDEGEWTAWVERVTAVVVE